MKLNIGGGPHFNHPGWINLDATTGFKLTPTCKFDMTNGATDLVYSSHCLEHLDDDTVQQVLAESRRVLKSDGRLVIVLPDFDKALQHYMIGDIEYFGGPWGFPSVSWSWPRKGVTDNIASRCSMIFCGFWNAAWGDHFGTRLSDSSRAYHGPAPVTGIELDDVFDMEIGEISKCLCSIVRQEETDFTFNHQNAWSRMEFLEILIASGFRTIVGESEIAIRRNQDIPGIAAMENISAYYEAVPA